VAFVLIEDQDGRRHVVRRKAIAATVEDPAGTTSLLLLEGQVTLLDQDLGDARAMVALNRPI
jgi:hypothetical protein